MTTLTERLNIVSGDVSDELSFDIIVANKKSMVVSDFVAVIDKSFSVEEFSEQELNDVANVIMDFATADELTFNGEVSIWFDAKISD